MWLHSPTVNGCVSEADARRVIDAVVAAQRETEEAVEVHWIRSLIDEDAIRAAPYASMVTAALTEDGDSEWPTNEQ